MSIAHYLHSPKLAPWDLSSYTLFSGNWFHERLISSLCCE